MLEVVGPCARLTRTAAENEALHAVVAIAGHDHDGDLRRRGRNGRGAGAALEHGPGEGLCPGKGGPRHGSAVCPRPL
jgi:hypothetical protein